MYNVLTEVLSNKLSFKSGVSAFEAPYGRIYNICVPTLYTYMCNRNQRTVYNGVYCEYLEPLTAHEEVMKLVLPVAKF